VCVAGSINCVEVAEVALRILHQLVRLQAAVDADGNPLQPLPIVHRTLASPQCLPHIVQVGTDCHVTIAQMVHGLMSFDSNGITATFKMVETSVTTAELSPARCSVDPPDLALEKAH